MGFVKEIVSEADKDLYNSFEIKDMLSEDKKYIYKWNSEADWVVDREQEIYFIYVTGGQNEAHPMQFNLICNGEKAVMYCEMKTHRILSQNDLTILHSVIDIIRIVAPKEFDAKQEALVDTIKSALKIYFTTIIRDGYCFDNQNTFDFGMIAKPIFI